MGTKLWTASESMNEHEEAIHYEVCEKPPVPSEGSTDFPQSPSETIEDADSSLEMTSQAIKTGFEQLSIVQSISDSLTSKKVCSEAYMTSLENYRPIMDQIIGQMGARRAIPSTEDFLNMHSAKSAHLIATEGLGEFMKKVWEKIKEFFTLFFKKAALYLKRMVKANLELENYEEYLEPMMAKLRSKGGSAKPTDLAAFDSKLPSLLADEGMEVMDTEYFMNYGVRKIDKLLTLMERVGFKGVGTLNDADGLSMLEAKIREFTVKHASITPQSLENLKGEAVMLQQSALGLLVSVFPHVVSDSKDLPEDIYSAIHDAFDRGQMGEGFVLRSLDVTNGGKDSLPKTANMFMAYSSNGSSFVEGHIYQNTYVRQMLTPPANFSSLQNLYDFYKNRVKKIKVQTADKSLDKTNDLIMKLLKLAETDLTKMAERITVAPSSGNSVEQDSDSLFDRLAAASTGAPDSVMDIRNESSPASTELVLEAKQVITDTSRMLANFFTRLQSILRFIMTSVYGVYTELRYEYVRYLYLSAQRYRVA